MEQDLLYLCNNDSITLLKSSAGGTEFPKLAKDLSNNLLTYQKITLTAHCLMANL